MKPFSLIALLAATPFGIASNLGRRNDTTPPKHWAVALFNSFDSIDVFGPLDPLFYLSFSTQIHLSLVAETLSPVYIRPASPALNVMNSTFSVSLNPTHTFASPPPEIDVLLIPGGPGVTSGNVTAVVDFVRRTYPSVKYLLTTCTGAGIAARAGVLDGKRATTNKAAWKAITSTAPDVEWVSPARWVVDGNVWTSSGVTSGLDLIFEFIETFYGADKARRIQGVTEYERNKGKCDDPFAEWHNVTKTGRCEV
ncbi:ThiJ/PfpI [Dendryphion nanum]|uniref:ThiJ/PfpI n=1 Tax=Dendryphion nanum TaxID=256645 RepID=A0A9P9DBD6_9PLEO|nr:ThiJ/PfpI [Dendryphion nanum]